MLNIAYNEGTANIQRTAPNPASAEIVTPPRGSFHPLTQALDWFCLRTQQKRENVAAAHLRLIGGIEVYSPLLRFEKMTRRGKVWFREALFPGYIFARFNLSTHQKLVTSAPGVAAIIRFGLWPSAVPERAIEEIRVHIGDGEHELSPLKIQPGDTVVVTRGIFQGLTSLVTQVVPARDRVRILLEFLGDCREVEVQECELLVKGRHILAA